MENTISQVAFEFTIEKMAQTNKRLVIIILALIIALVGSNLAWIIYDNQYEDVVTTQTVKQDAENGTNEFIGGDIYGFSDDNNHD